jgi:hypothetical protein
MKSPMRISRGTTVRIALVLAVAVFLWVRLGRHRGAHPANSGAIPDRAVTSQLNQPGGGAAPDEAYAIYSALYQVPAGEPLVFSEDSVTDIPQVNGSCLKPSTNEERVMTEAFEEANQQSHRWEKKFAMVQGYQLLSRSEASQAQACLDKHDQSSVQCEKYSQLRHLRFLGVPGLDPTHTRALVSIVRMCGSFCGNGGIFEVEKSGTAWRRAETTAFTRECSWMY